MKQNNFDNFIHWYRIIDGDALRKQIEAIMKAVQEAESSIEKETSRMQTKEKIEGWLNRIIDDKNN